VSTKIAVRPIATPQDQATLGALMVEPEASMTDTALYAPQAAAILLLGLALVISPAMPKEPKK
jgi:hypothetical protein